MNKQTDDELINIFIIFPSN